MVTLLQDEHAHLVFTLNFELCALLNCLFFLCVKTEDQLLYFILQNTSQQNLVPASPCKVQYLS